MNILVYLWGLFLIVALGYVIYEFITGFLPPAQNFWHRCLNGAKRSATILWARALFVAGLILSGLEWLANFLGQPGVANAIQVHADPKIVSIVFIAIAVITEIARRRTL